MIARFWLAVAALCLSACSPADDPVQDYLERLSNVLKLELEPIEPPAMLTFPSARQLVLPKPEIKLSVRDFLSLRGCKLHQVLAEGNSQLGKVAGASQRFIRDLETLQAGPACLEFLRLNEQTALAQKLQEFLASKQDELLASAWSAMLGAPEHAAFWSNQPTPANYPTVILHPQEPALSALSAIAESIKAQDSQLSAQKVLELESHLASLRFGDGGILLKELSNLAFRLAQANALIKIKLGAPLCFQGRPSPAARNLQNVVNSFFVPNVQAYAVLLKRRHQQLMTHIHAIESALSSASPKAYKDWQMQRDRVFTLSLEATLAHVTLLQKLYAQCGLTAGNAVG